MDVCWAYFGHFDFVIKWLKMDLDEQTQGSRPLCIKNNDLGYVPSEDSDQLWHPPSMTSLHLPREESEDSGKAWRKPKLI